MSLLKAKSDPIGSNAPEKATAAAAGPPDQAEASPQVHHQITITTGNINTYSRKNSFKHPSPWFLDPKKVLFFSAIVSSLPFTLKEACGFRIAKRIIPQVLEVEIFMADHKHTENCSVLVRSYREVFEEADRDKEKVD